MTSSYPLNKRSDIGNEKQSWVFIWCYVALVSIPLLVGVGTPLILIFPASSLLLGCYLYFKSPNLYVGFVLWMFFLCPVIRRLIDLKSGFITPGPWGFTFLLVSAISLLTVFRHFPTASEKGGLPFLLSISAIGYAFLVGVTQNPPNAVMNETFGWVCPIAFSFHLLTHWRDYPQLKAVFQKAFLWGVLVMGAYGVYQYIFAPPWEKFWLDAMGIVSFGHPVPFGLRVMSTVGSPQAFAGLMLVGLIIICCETANPMVYVASGFGYVSLILTMARAVWLSAVISIPLFLLSLKPSFQIRMIAVLLVIFIIVACTLLSWEPVYEQFYARFESFLNVENDISFNARSEGYHTLWAFAVTQFVGKGVGFSTRGFDTAIGVNDSSLFPLIFTFGWLGLLFYLSGFFLIFTKLLQIPDASSDIFIGACRMAAICVLLQAGFNSVFNGSIGLLMWSLSALSLAGHKYYRYQSISSDSSVP